MYAMPIMDGRPVWNGWKDGWVGALAIKWGIGFFRIEYLSTFTFYACDWEGAVKHCRCTGLSKPSLNACAFRIIYRVYDCTCVYIFYTNRSRGFYYLVKKNKSTDKEKYINI